MAQTSHRQMAVVVIAAFLLGLAVGHFTKRVPTPVSDKQPEIAHHWERVIAYNRFVRDPANDKRTPDRRFTYVEVPFDPLPHLAALHSAGEIEYVQLSIPGLMAGNRRANRHWMTFLDREDVLYSMAPTAADGIATSGRFPLILNIWFKEEAKPVIQVLIRDLEAIAAQGEEST